MAAKPAREQSPAEDRAVALGALLFMLLFFGGGLLGYAVLLPYVGDAGSLIGLIVGAVIWTFLYGALLRRGLLRKQPLETSPFDEDQPVEDVEETEDDYETEVVDLDAFEMEQARQAEEYPPRKG